MENTTPNGLHLMLPFPEGILSPNVKAHWSKKHAAYTAGREAAYILAYNTGVKLNADSHYICTLIFCPPDKRNRDLDNLVAAMKGALDGVCRAVGIDDRNIRPIPDWGPVVAGGKVELTLIEKTGA